MQGFCKILSLLLLRRDLLLVAVPFLLQEGFLLCILHIPLFYTIFAIDICVGTIFRKWQPTNRAVVVTVADFFIFAPWTNSSVFFSIFHHANPNLRSNLAIRLRFFTESTFLYILRSLLHASTALWFKSMLLYRVFIYLHRLVLNLILRLHSQLAR